MKHGFVAVQIANVVDNAALVVEDPLPLLRLLNPLVGKGDHQSTIQVGQFLQPAGNLFTVELHVFKNGIIRQEAHQRALLSGITYTLQGILRNAGSYFAQLFIPLGSEAHTPVGPITVYIHG